MTSMILRRSWVGVVEGGWWGDDEGEKKKAWPTGRSILHDEAVEMVLQFIVLILAFAINQPYSYTTLVMLLQKTVTQAICFYWPYVWPCGFFMLQAEKLPLIVNDIKDIKRNVNLKQRLSIYHDMESHYKGKQKSQTWAIFHSGQILP